MPEHEKNNPRTRAADVDLENEGIDLWEYARIVRRHWLLICLVATLSVGLTTFVTLRMTKIYRATNTIRIETQPPQVLGRDVEDVVKMGTGSFWSNIEYYETQYKIIESRDVASRVVREFRLHEDPVFMSVPEEDHQAFEPVTIEEAAGMLQGMLTVEPVKDSRLVRIHVDHPDPARAKLYANAIGSAYVRKNLEAMLQGTVDAVDWLAKQLDDAKQKLDQSEDALRQYKKDNGILSIALDDRQNILTAQMTAAATKLTEALATRIEVQARKNAIAHVAKSNDFMAVPLDVINASPLIQQLKQDHGRLSQEYGELSERYGENFPVMKELKAKLNRIGGDIAREVKNILRAVDAELMAARSTESGLQKTLDAFRQQALDLTQKELAYNRLARESKNNEKIYELLLGRSKEAGLSKLLKVNNIHILDPALLPESPIKPRLSVNLALALLMGLVLGLGLAFILEFTDRTIKTPEDVSMLNVAFLGIVPSINSSSANTRDNGIYSRSKQAGNRKRKNRPLPKAGNGAKPINYDTFVHEYPKSQVAESCRSIRTNLLFMTADQDAKRILVTSPSPQEGKTTVAVNLAIAMAQSGSRVLLVDTDMRRPRVHKAFNHPARQVGLSTMILGEATHEQAVSQTEVPNLDILPCGPTPPNPAELMLTERFVKLIEELSQKYDRVIFDSPPVAVVTDAAILSKHVDGTVIILKSQSTTRDAAKHAVGVLKDIEANILGVVLNALDLENSKYGKHYYYYYKDYGSYYAADTQDEPPENPSEDESVEEAEERA